MSGEEFTLMSLGAVIGLFVLACVAVIVSRVNELDGRCKCNGDCMQGRTCPARKR